MYWVHYLQIFYKYYYVEKRIKRIQYYIVVLADFNLLLLYLKSKYDL
jgi:hypothetical protein